MRKFIVKKDKMLKNGVKFNYETKFNGVLVMSFIPISGEGGFTHEYEYHQDNAPTELLKLAYESVQESMVGWHEIADKYLGDNYAWVSTTKGDVMNITIKEVEMFNE